MFKIIRLIFIISPVIYAARKPASFADVVLNEIQTETYDKDIVTCFKVYFVRLNGRRAINGAFMYNQVIPNMQLKFTLSFEKPDKTRFDMLDLTMNVCSFLNGTYSNLKIPRLALKEMSKQAGFPKHCPIPANKTLTVENFKLPVLEFPLPNLKFIFNVTAYDGDKRKKIVSFALKGATKRFHN